MNLKRSFLLIGLIVMLPLATLTAQDKKALELSDLMKFKQIQSPSISEDGKWVTFAAVPDRGDPEVVVYSANGKEKYLIPQGKSPLISSNGLWVATTLTSLPNSLEAKFSSFLTKRTSRAASFQYIMAVKRASLKS